MKAMKPATETTLCVVAAMLLVTTIAPFATAQDPGYDAQQRTICEGPDRLEFKSCAARTSDDSPALTLEDASTGVSERIQTRRDLTYLKAVADYLARASQSEDPDFKAIGSTAAQVRKRVERLRSMLALPSSGTSAGIRELELPTDRPQLKLFIYSLSIQISDAARNPLLKGRLLDVTGSARARADLDAIIESAKRIRTQCELFSRTGPK